MDPDPIRAEWDRLAEAWERHDGTIAQMARPVTDWLIASLGPRPGHRILEVAAGTGQVAVEVAGRTGDRGRVIATDLAPSMVAAIRRRAGGDPRVASLVMDAQALGLAAASVDAAVSRWGFMLVPDARAAFAETARVLRPGGRLALAVWGPAETNPWIVVPGAIALSTGLLETSDPNAEGGIFSLATPERLASALEGSGLVLARTEELPLVLRFGSFEDVWTYSTSLLSEVSRALLAAPDREEVRGLLREYLAGFAEGDGYAVPGLTLAAEAVRP